jgi:hypothetical protein
MRGIAQKHTASPGSFIRFSDRAVTCDLPWITLQLVIDLKV